MKILISLMALLTASCCSSVRAQTTDQWAEVSPGDELFRVLMPRQPEQENQKESYGELFVSGKRFTAIAGGASYTVWSFVDVNNRQSEFSDSDARLDASADLIWESLLKPARDKLPKDGRVRSGMTYIKEIPMKPLVGREYSVTIGELTGTTRLYVADARIYMLLAMHNPNGAWNTEEFFQSFRMRSDWQLSATVSAPGGYGPGIQGGGPGVRSGVGDPIDYNRIFAGREVTEKAHILSRAEPSYTESARKYGVQGTIVLRAVFSKDGQVTNIVAVSKLPHGLTQAAVAATKRIKFVPALKDGHAVSQWMQLEYNFNLY